MTIIGSTRLGNDYKADKQTITLYKGEDIRNNGKVEKGAYILNKVEMRYNTRKNLPSYPAMKSLYRWRSVFGYHLGGVLRQGVVKLAEIGRPVINTGRFIKALATGKMHEYKRLYSTRQVFNFVRDANKKSESVGLLKYATFKQIPQNYHEATSGDDNSLRNILTQKIAHVHSRKEFKEELESKNSAINILNNRDGKSRDLIDVDEKLRAFDKHSSYVSDLVGNAKEKVLDVTQRISFKVSHQMDRLKYFFKEASRSDMKTAYREMVETSREHEQIYQERFNNKYEQVEAPKNENNSDVRIVERGSLPNLRYVNAPRHPVKPEPSAFVNVVVQNKPNEESDI